LIKEKALLNLHPCIIKLFDHGKNRFKKKFDCKRSF
jgi:hypothetical protein